MNLRVKDWLSVLRRPGCWFGQQDTFSAEWDAKLTWLLDSGYHFDTKGQHRAVIGDYEVWTSNHPYASFRYACLRPRRATILRAHAQWLRDMFPAYGITKMDRLAPALSPTKEN